jgi:hypothetical protein
MRMISSCIIRNNYYKLLGNIRREKTLGEMWAAVIWTIKQPPPDGVASDAGPKWGKAGVSRCSEGDHEGIFTRCLKKNGSQVCTLLKSCAFRKEEFQSYCQPYRKISLENQDPKSQWLRYWCKSVASKRPLPSFLMCKICLTITGVYFS